MDPETEEVVNAVTHGLGFVLSLVGFGYLVFAYWPAPGLDFAGAVTFGGALVLTYGASTFYHAWTEGEVKKWLRRLDHAAIFLLIAGTYTPFTLAILHPAWGLPVFTVVWAAAGTGVVLKFVDIDKLPVSNRAAYLALGWVALAVMYPLATTLPTLAFVCLIAGGLAYTGGTVFYAWDNLPLNHGIWHLFVLAGSGFHYASVVMVSTAGM